MKKIRKAISLLVVMVMALSLIPQVVLGATYTTDLESYFRGWERTGVSQNGSTIFACVTNEIAHSGSNSVVLRHTDSSESGYIQIKPQNLSVGEGTYTLSFWVAGEVTGKQVIWIKPGNTTPNGDWLLINSAVTNEVDGDWTKCSTTFTVESGNTVNELLIGTNGETTGLYLDDISIVKEGTTNNLLKNGNFDFDGTTTYTADYEDYFQGWGRNGGATSNTTNVFACVTNAIAHDGNNSVVLRHTDSSQSGYIQIQQTDLSVGEGTYTLSFWVAGEVNGQQVIWIKPGNTTPNGDWLLINSVATNEVDGDWRKYSTTFTVEPGNTVTELTFGTNGNTKGLYIDDISIAAQGTTNNLLKNGGFEEKAAGEEPEEPEIPEVPTYTTELEPYFQGWERTGVSQNGNTIFACVTNEIAHDGNNSVVLRHTDSSQGGYIQIKPQNLSVGEGTYTLSFWVAGEVNGKQVIWIKPGNTTPNGDWLLINSAATNEVDGDWRKYSTTFTVESGNTVNELLIGTNGETTGLYLDDISIAAQGTTNNLLKNGGFEEKAAGEEPEEPEIPTYTTEFEPYFVGWERGTEVTQNGSTIFACVTNAIAHSGSNSVALKHSNADGYIQIVQNNLSLGEGTYTLSFWAAGEVNDGQTVIWIKPGTPFGENDWSLVAKAKTSEVDGMWTKYSTTFTVEPGEGTVTQLMIGTKDTTGLYLDDISIVASGSEENFVKNGGFELTEIIEEPTGPKYTEAYAEYAYGWGQWYVADRDDSTYFSCVTNETAHTGNHSFLLRHTDSSKNGKALSLVQEGLTLTGTYTLSFWAKGIRTDVDMQAVTLNGDAWTKYPLKDYEPVETDGEWSKYTFDVTVPEGKTNNTLVFCADGETEGWYIDDISLVAQGTTNNILKNSGFDFSENAKYTDVYEGYFTGWVRNGGVTSNTTNVFACVTNAIAHDGNNSVVLRHTDSTQGGYIQIQQTSLSLGEGTYTLSFWVAGEVNGQQVIWIKPGTPFGANDWSLITNAKTDETDGMWTKYSTTFTVEPGEGTVTELTIGTNGNTKGLYIDDIRIEARGDNSNLLKNGSFEFNGNAEYTGAYEDYFTGWDRGTEVTPDESTVFACVTNAIAHSGSNSVALKHSNANGYIQIVQNNLSLGEGTYTLSFWAAGEVNDGQTVIWIKPGTPFGENDWSLVAKAKTNEVDGMWTKYSTTFTVEPGEGTVTQLMIGTKDTRGLYLDDISIVMNGTTNNRISNGSFEQKTLSGYYISTPKVVKIDGENRKELTALESGNLEVSVEVTNYSMGDEFAPILIVALYEGETLKTMEYIEQDSNKSSLEGFLEDEMCFTVEVPEMTAGTDYTLKVMCWKSWSELIPLIDALELE